MRTGIELIAAERKRQVKKGWTAKHDSGHTDGELSMAASVYAEIASHRTHPRRPLPLLDAVKEASDRWPWNGDELKAEFDPIENLVKAGAMIAAEIDRLQRAKREQHS
jgi:hypothetical protein